jgi:hypothetical protein
MTVETVARIVGMQTVHQSVAGDFSDNGRRGNCRTLPVALDDPALGHRQ